MNTISKLFNIKYPIISGGMVWCSGWKLASAVSNAGGLGLIGAGSMHPDTLKQHIQKTKLASAKPFGVNIPLMYPEMDQIVDIIISEKVPIVFTSAGSPKKWTPLFKQHGIKVAHVVSSAFFAKKCEEAGVDAIVAEGVEAGGHNGAEETSTMTLIPSIREHCKLPLLAAGGIATGSGMLAAMALGADGVQIGSRFAVTHESSAHIDFKQKVVETQEGETQLRMKKLVPTRLINNTYCKQVKALEDQGASREELIVLKGSGRAKEGIFLGDIENGELEIGQNASLINEILSVKDVFHRLLTEYQETLQEVCAKQGKYCI